LFRRGKTQPDLQADLQAILTPLLEAYGSCPEEGEYLQEAGEQGWELVAVMRQDADAANADAADVADAAQFTADLVISTNDRTTHTLYLKRSK